MELKSLYTVRKIIETGSYQKTAMALNYAQSTITFQIRQLENELNVRLFEKSGNKMVMTEEGKDILPMIDQVITAADALLCYKKDQGDIRGTLRIALPETLVTYEMQGVLKTFKEKAPDVRLSLQVMNCYAIYDQLLNGACDIAIHYDVRNYPRSITTRELKTYPVVMVASPDLDNAQMDFTTPGQRKSICHIQNDPNALYLKILESYLKSKNITLDTGLEVWSIEAIKRSVMSNLGVAFLPRFAVESELEQGLLLEIPMDVTGEITSICAYQKNRWKSPAMELFLQTLDMNY